MAKTFNNLYNNLLSYSKLEEAFSKAKLGKSNKQVVSKFTDNLPVELSNLLDELETFTYKPRPYRTFEVFEPKQRTIHAPHFRDVVVQRAIFNIIEPIFEATFIHTSFGCRKNKGTHKASDTLQKLLRSSNVNNYYIQMDISKYFYRVNRDILIKLIEKKISDKNLVNLIKMFLPNDTGMPIGNLLSQLFSNIYLNQLDQFCKRTLKIKKYVRYVDDFVVLDKTKEEIHHILTQIKEFLKTLKLTLSRFTIQRITRGVNFCGYRTWRRTKFIRKKSLLKFREALNNYNIRSLMSILGHTKPTANFTSLIELTRKKSCQKFTNLHRSQKLDRMEAQRVLRTLRQMKFSLSAH